MMIEFADKLDRLTGEIVQRLHDVYHLTDEDAMRLLKRSRYYAVMSDIKNEFWKKDAEINFRLLQNEIEYGAWNKNENGGIAE
ncbi:MAG: hypothetical protein J6K55_14135 [Clostridia bacterium]|nr:hypothetical protein [Clostridia bacterium]